MNGLWTEVKISARIFRFPDMCACCSRSADTFITVRATKAKGVKVIRYESKEFEVPYCSECLRHIDVCLEVDETRRKALAMDTACFLELLLMLIAILSVMGGWIFVLIKCFNLVVFLGALMAIPAMFTTYYITAFLWSWWGRQVKCAKDKKVQAIRKSQIALNNANSLLYPGCCRTRLAVHYEGWSGSVHTFLFHNRYFAEAFVNSNRKKCLSIKDVRL